MHTATYDVNVASWMGNVVADTSDGTGFPSWVGATWEKAAVLRYGENPHQRAALYTSGFVPQPGLAQAEQLHGKEMSYNNYVDADAAVRAAMTTATSRRSRSSSTPTPAASRWATPSTSPTPRRSLRPRLGVRRHHRHQQARDRRDGRTGQGRLHRGRRRTGVRRRGARDPQGQEEHPAAHLPGTCPGRGGDRPISGGLLMHQSRDTVDAEVEGRRRRPVTVVAGLRRARGRGDPG